MPNGYIPPISPETKLANSRLSLELFSSKNFSDVIFAQLDITAINTSTKIEIVGAVIRACQYYMQIPTGKGGDSRKGGNKMNTSSIQSENSICKHEKTFIDTTGSLSFDGEVFDDLDQVERCSSCFEQIEQEKENKPYEDDVNF